MGTWKRTPRRVAILRELADLGLTQMEASCVTGVSPAAIHHMAKKHGIKFKLGRRGVKPVLKARILRDFGKDGMTPEVMAERYGTSRNSVSSTISGLRNEGLLPRPETKKSLRYQLTFADE